VYKIFVNTKLREVKGPSITTRTLRDLAGKETFAQSYVVLNNKLVSLSEYEAYGIRDGDCFMVLEINEYE
jgi:hypothetical protein